MVSAIAIETCAAWPEGRHPVAFLGDDEALCQVSRPRLDRARLGACLPLYGFEPVGGIDRGEETLVAWDVTCERMAGALFVRAWLDTVRAAFPGVRWRVAQPLVGLGEGPMGTDLRCAYACLGGRVVGAVVELSPESSR